MFVVAVLLLLFQSLECTHLMPRRIFPRMVCVVGVLLFMFGSIFVIKRWADAYVAYSTGVLCHGFCELSPCFSSRSSRLNCPEQIRRYFGWNSRKVWRLKDVRANCYCASLLRTKIHATSSMSARARLVLK